MRFVAAGVAAVVLTVAAWVSAGGVLSGPGERGVAGAQIVSTTEPPPTTEPPTTNPPTVPTTSAPTTAPPTTQPPRPTTTRPRARPTTTARGATTTVVKTTTSLTLPTASTTPPPTTPPPPLDEPHSGEFPPLFPMLSGIGLAVAAGAVGLQWFLTRPGRTGRTL